MWCSTFLALIFLTSDIICIENRIINGDDVSDQEFAASFSYQVALKIPTISGSRFCSGAILSTQADITTVTQFQFIVTAGHCLQGVTTSVAVYGGAANLTDFKFQDTTSSYYKPDNYSANPPFDDLAVIKLSKVFNITEVNAKPLGLPSVGTNKPTYITSGWGSRSSGSSTITQNLKQIRLTNTSPKCSDVYPSVSDDSFICASADGGSICHGDSGAPLRYATELHGAASFTSIEGCESDNPAGFTKIYKHTDWLKKIINL